MSVRRINMEPTSNKWSVVWGLFNLWLVAKNLDTTELDAEDWGAYTKSPDTNVSIVEPTFQ